MRTTTRTQRRAWAGALAALTSLVLAGCSLGAGTDRADDGGEGAGGSGSSRGSEVVVATHDSWNMSKQVLRAFTRETGYQLTVQPAGDAGALTNKLVLTKGSPIADAVYGVDNTFASRAVEAGVLAGFSPDTNPGSDFEPEDETAAAQLTPVDYSDVCVNVDDVWFREHDLDPPSSFEDLTEPRYRGLFVTPAPSTSSPGLAFLLATVAEYGEDGWQDYWRRLVDNDVKVTAGWSDAYQVDFTAGGGSGDRPIVLSYASSPPFTIPEGEDRPTTSALLDTCFRQVEYAAVLDGADNPEGAQAFVDFLGSREFQQALPEHMYVFPVDPDASLPALWARFATPADEPASLPETEIAANRARWLEEWADIAQ